MYCRCKHWRSCPSSDKSKHFAFKQRLYWAMSDAQISTQPVVTFTSFWCDWQQPLRLITSVAFAFCVSLNVGSVSRASFRSFEHFAAPDFVIRPAEVRRAGEQRRAQKISSDAVVVGGRVDDSLVCGRVKGRRRCSFVIRAVLTASEWPATAADSTARGSQRGPRIPRCLAVRSELSAALCWHRSLARSLARLGINEALSSRWSIGSRSAGDLRPSGRPAGRTLRRRRGRCLHLAGRNFLREWVGPTSDRTTGPRRRRCHRTDTGLTGRRAARPSDRPPLPAPARLRARHQWRQRRPASPFIGDRQRVSAARPPMLGRPPSYLLSCSLRLSSFSS